ncbi:Uncharacterised protein [Enterobacter cloacae]|nr:Uncharacterised protein [Enterobacter cloacae]
MVRKIRNLAEPRKQKTRHRRVLLNSGAGLGIISTINMLFVIGFIGISLKQRTHEGPHKKSLCFCDGYHEKSLFSE